MGEEELHLISTPTLILCSRPATAVVNILCTSMVALDTVINSTSRYEVHMAIVSPSIAIYKNVGQTSMATLKVTVIRYYLFKGKKIKKIANSPVEARALCVRIMFPSLALVYAESSSTLRWAWFLSSRRPLLTHSPAAVFVCVHLLCFSLSLYISLPCLQCSQSSKKTHRLSTRGSGNFSVTLANGCALEMVKDRFVCYG